MVFPWFQPLKHHIASREFVKQARGAVMLYLKIPKILNKMANIFEWLEKKNSAKLPNGNLTG